MRKTKKTWLWQISAANLPGYSYLFGTIHIRDKRAFAFLEEALDYMQECSTVATEFNLDHAQGGSQADSLDLPDSFSLEEVLGEKCVGRLEFLFKEHVGISFRGFAHMHPFVLVSLLTESIMSKDMPMTLDQTIWSAAKAQGKELDGIETYEFQMNLINELSLTHQVQMLKQLVRNFKSFRKKQNKLVGLYAEADLGRINRVSRDQAGAFRKQLLYQRNYTMADRIEEMSQKSTHFFAVGGGHLPGKNGLIRLLKQKGFRISPVFLEAQAT